MPAAAAREVDQPSCDQVVFNAPYLITLIRRSITLADCAAMGKGGENAKLFIQGRRKGDDSPISRAPQRIVFRHSIGGHYGVFAIGWQEGSR
jgi:hypothetical protein